ncbi:helix-turn-helix domain-containing protein [Omnitrophica bacterium]|nr:helix-turn-helix domain-containing protein [Candidatus Omnitrophota bacterium]
MRGRKEKCPPFVMVRRDMLKDPDWRKLSNAAKVLYIHLRSKFNYKTLSNVKLAYSEVEDMMSSKTIRRAFKELEDNEWIEKTKQGGLFGGVCSYKFIGKFKDFYYKGHTV